MRQSILIALLCASLSFAQYITIQSLEVEHIPTVWQAQTVSDDLASKELSFLVHLRQCNLDTLEETFWAVSDPKNSRYGKYQTLDEINSLVQCESDDQTTVSKYFSAFDASVEAIGTTALRVTCSVSTAEKMLQTSFFEFTHSESKMTVIRQVGPVQVPSEISEIIYYISSIGDFFVNGKYGPISDKSTRTSFLKRQLSVGPILPQTLSDVFVNPHTIRTAYGIPKDVANTTQGSIGIAAFGNSYSQEDVCRFNDMFSESNSYSEITDLVLPISPATEGTESDLDVQYSTNIARGVPEQFSDWGNGYWILDWATYTVQDDSRAYVWSISYGFPEVYQCLVEQSNTTGACTSYAKYIALVDTEFQKLGNLGVSVMVAAGDDGTPGFATNCPVSLDEPLFAVFNGEGEYLSCDVVLNNADAQCECAGVYIDYTDLKGETYTCPYPAGYFYAGLGQLSYTCDFLVSMGEAGTLDYINNTYTEYLSQKASGCDSTPSDYNLGEDAAIPFAPFYSTCSCDKFQAVTKSYPAIGKVVVRPQIWDATVGPTFLPDYPTSSRYVTSVGATALQYSTSYCQPDITANQIYCSTPDPSGYSGGGGFSMFQDSFQAQRSAVQKYLSTASNLPPTGAYNSSARAYPDVSALGHNFVLVTLEPFIFFEIPEQIQLVGGTSAASPTFAGIVALLNHNLLSKGKATLGYLNPLLYQMAAEEPSTFTDIVPVEIMTFNTTVTAGATSACTQDYCCQYGFDVTTGWDPATGLGTPNFPAMLAYVMKAQGL